MCGRYTLATTAETIAQTFNLLDIPQLTPRYNIAPSQPVSVIGRTGVDSPRQLKQFRWGLIPRWAKDTNIGYRLINARAETVAEKPAFRSAFRRRRCLVISSGFYEWEQQKRDRNAPKQPHYFRMRSQLPFAFAGLWEQWQSPEGETLRSCTILTTEANAVLKPVHSRMPVILNPEDYGLWLDPTIQDRKRLQALLRPCEDKLLESYPVDTQVNRPLYDSPDCIQPLPDEPQADIAVPSPQTLKA